ncbi:MAG: HAMP domain-containing protein [Treponema sp.]|nr:HAMP domain-containing protein [Treponema sp.]
MEEKKVKSLANKIISGNICLVFILLLGLGITTYVRIKTINENQFTEKLSTTMRLTDTTLAAFFGQMSNNATQLSLISNSDEDEILDFETLILNANEHVLSASISYINEERTVCYPEGQKDYYALQDQDWFNIAQDMDGIPYFSPVYVNEDGDTAIACAITTHDEDDEISGVAMVEFRATSLGLQVGDETTMGNIKFYMIDAESNVVVNPFEGVFEIRSAADLGLKSLDDYVPGTMALRDEKVNGINYEIRILGSVNNAMALDYVMLIPKSDINAGTNSIIRVVIIALAIGLILALVVSYLLAHGIVKPLKDIIAILKNIADGDGDLTVRLPVLAKNELGQLSRFFNQTIEKIANSLKSIITESTHMGEVGDKLSFNMSESASEINQISANVSNIKNQVELQSDSVDQTNSSVSIIAGNIEKLNQNIGIQSQNVAQSSAAVEEMVANIKSVTDILEQNQQNVIKLSESAEMGRTVVAKTVEITTQVAEDSEGLLETSSIIQSIASQTNLLAMNAAIEAAHAGEAGRGFAVVADEIRKLAEDSNRQGKKITVVLKKLREMIMGMTQNGSELQKQFQAIFEHTTTVSDQERVIKNAMDEQANGSKQVIDAMNEINSITAEVRSSAEEMKNGSKGVLDQMDKLAKVTVQINSAMKEISNGISAMDDTMQEVNGIGHENARSIQNVISEINKFKVQEDEDEAGDAADIADTTVGGDASEEVSVTIE